MKRKITIASMAFWLTLNSAIAGSAEPTPTVNHARYSGEAAATKEERTYLLEVSQTQLTLDRARAELDAAQVNLDEMKQLFGEKIVAIDELKRAEQAERKAKLDFQKAVIELEKTRLRFLKDATLITVVEAKKYRRDGRYLASVSLRNDSDFSRSRIAMGGHERVSDEELKALLNISNVIVQLLGKEMTDSSTEDAPFSGIVGDPYQHILPLIRHGEERTIEFQLLKNVDAVNIQISYGETQKSFPVFLKKEAAEDLPVLTVMQYQQLGQLGTVVSYNIEMERLAETDQSFSLVVLNLPAEIPFAFKENDATVTQVRFDRETTRRSLNFEVSLSEKLDQTFVDQNITFDILVTRPPALKMINTLRRKYQGQHIPAEEIVSIDGNRAEMQLVPKGVGKLDIVVTNLFSEIVKGDTAVIRFNILNSGTLMLRDVAPELDLPLGWDVSISPKSADSIEPGDKVMFTIDVRPPVDVPVGDYATKIAAEGHSGIETIEGVAKNFTVRIAAQRNVTATFVLVAVLIVLVLAIAIASIKISRR